MVKNYKIRGTHCNSCKIIIEEELKQIKGIKHVDVNLKKQTILIDYDESKIKISDIKKIVKKLGYEIVENNENSKTESNSVLIPVLVTMIMFLLLTKLVPDYSTILTSGSKLSLIMLFIIGVTTSFHCVSMCGGIALSQVNKESTNHKSSIMYNLGRVISYTVLGGIVGLIGAGITLDNTFFAIVPILVGLFMILMGLSNAQIISLSNLKFMEEINVKLGNLRNKLGHNKGPFILGLINGFMPCGPLQLMQIYALSTGSFVSGALAMFVFSIGTVPLMLGLGVFVKKLSVTSKEMVFKTGGYIIILLGATMMFNGLSTVGINIPFLNIAGTQNDENVARIEGDYQIVELDVDSRDYGDFVVKKGIPVKLVLNVAPGKLNGCNYAIIMPQSGSYNQLTEGENVIEFLPSEEGTFQYTCWMGMIKNNITVIDEDLENYVAQR